MMSDSEEEILVYVELEDDVEIGNYKNINILDINSQTPTIQMDDTFFTGKYENPLGTYMFFKDSPPPKGDPLFDKISEKNLEFVCKAKKFIKMEHAYITPNENMIKQKYGNEKKQSSDSEIVKFKTFEEALEKFKEYWMATTPPTEEVIVEESDKNLKSKSCGTKICGTNSHKWIRSVVPLCEYKSVEVVNCLQSDKIKCWCAVP